jgi:replicative DNA helicase
VGYYTSSFKLAQNVKDILLKFGILARVNDCMGGYKKKDGSMFRRRTYQVCIRDIYYVKKFITEIGFYGKKNIVANKIMVLSENGTGSLNDMIPADIWKMLREKFKQYRKTRCGCRKKYRRNVYLNIKNDYGHCGNLNKGMSRETLRKIAGYLDDDAELLSICNSDIYWDRIKSIKKVGDKHVYDIEMPGNHNFISNNIVTHNSNTMLNIAANCWSHPNDPVLIVPLEMPRDMWFSRLLSRQTGIPFEKVIHPHKSNLSDIEFERMASFKKTYADNINRMFIMDPSRRVPVSVIRSEIEKHIEIFKPRLVVVDYIANLIPELHYRNARPDLQIGEMLKDLRIMGRPGAMHDRGFGVVSGAQIGREALKRIRKLAVNKQSFYSEDLRGSHEYSADADNIFVQQEDEKMLGERMFLYNVKTRYGKKTFSNGERRAVLEIKPEICLVRSLNLPTGNSVDMFNKLDDISSKDDLDFTAITPDNVSSDADVDDIIGSGS